MVPHGVGEWAKVVCTSIKFEAARCNIIIQLLLLIDTLSAGVSVIFGIATDGKVRSAVSFEWLHAGDAPRRIRSLRTDVRDALALLTRREFHREVLRIGGSHGRCQHSQQEDPG